MACAAWQHGCDAVVLGASTGDPDRFALVAEAVFDRCPCPLLLFPNGAQQVVPHADAILFMSLLSGRNPRYLVEEQVKGAPRVRECGLEAIPTAYLLVDSGQKSTVEHVSETQPLPRHLPELAFAHALAARYLGMSLVYLEAGSGAPQSVPPAMVTRCVEAGLKVAVGGGVRTPETACDLVRSGASFVVVGNHFENRHAWTLFSEIASAVHTREAALVP
jgi:phosphoglycerol geranylgeranyltransferase